MALKRGLSANRDLSPRDKTSGVNNLPEILSKLKNNILVGRVKDIILNNQYPEIEKYGGENGIGTIFFELNNRFTSKTSTATPFYPQSSSFPLVNEMVLLFQLPNTNMGVNPSESSYYYINMINLWNHPHHNAYPNPITTTTLPDSQQKDYQQTQAGSVRRVTDESTDINLNSPINPSQNTFIERTNIHPLLPFSGDNLYQGRWGNSIRLGSTAKPKGLPPLNDWSYIGENGDPIIILRNGQPPTATNEGWVPITEDINNDLSSIYQTSTQQIPIETVNNEFTSYNPSNSPIKPNKYIEPQIILNSNRLVFNAKKDHVLISGEESVFLGGNRSVNINAGRNMVLECSNIKLGSKNATESVVKGDILYENLDKLLSSLLQVVSMLKYQQKWPGGIPAPDAEMSVVASSAETMINTIQADLKNILSKQVKTI